VPVDGGVLAGVVELGESPVDEPQLAVLVINHHLSSGGWEGGRAPRYARLSSFRLPKKKSRV